MFIPEEIIVFIVAFIASLFSSIAGGGGGLIVTPALIFMGLPFTMALGTGKTSALGLGIGSSLRYAKDKLLDWKHTLFLCLMGPIPVTIGVYGILHTPNDIAVKVLGILTMSLSAYSFFKKQLGKSYAPKNRTKKGYAIGGIGIFIVGLFSGAFGAGSGLFNTIWNIRWFGMDYKRAVAHTMFVLGLAWNCLGSGLLIYNGQIVWSYIPALMLGYLVGGYCGAHIAIKKGNAFIKHLFEVVAFILGLKLLLS